MSDSAAAASKAFIRSVVSGHPDAGFRVQLWNGDSFDASEGARPRFTLVLKRPDALRTMLAWPTDRSICEAYFGDVFDLDGDFEEVFRVAELLGRGLSAGRAPGLLRRYYSLPKGKRPVAPAVSSTVAGAKGSLGRDRAAVSQHYDVSDEFYALWLDPKMVYSGAYHASPDEDLASAQNRKLDEICRLLRLKPGDRLLDIGCGWGALAMHAAEHFGADVLGVTLSHRQADFANRLIQERGLADRCRIELKDYRSVAPTTPFDAVASVEMLHHVRGEDLPSYFGHVNDLLRPGGLSYHLAVTAAPGLKKPPRFARQYFMPDFSLLPFHTLVEQAEKARLDVLSSQGLRVQYWLTARKWVESLEERQDAAISQVGLWRFRIWKLSLSLMAYSFKTSALRFHHLVLAKRGGDWPPESAFPDSPTV